MIYQIFKYNNKQAKHTIKLILYLSHRTVVIPVNRYLCKAKSNYKHIIVKILKCYMDKLKLLLLSRSPSVNYAVDTCAPKANVYSCTVANEFTGPAW